MSFYLAKVRRLDLETFARSSGLHPELVARFVTLGLIDAEPDPAGDLWFAPSQLAVARRIQRLRAGLSLNYAGVGVVMELLDRVNQLETALRRQSQFNGGRRWT